MGQALLVGSLRELKARGDDIDMGTWDLTNTKPYGTGVDIPDNFPVRAKLVDLIFAVTGKNEDVPDGKGGMTKARSWRWLFEITEPGYEGAQRSMMGRAPDGSETGQKSLRTLRTASESAGFTPAEIEVGAQNYLGGYYLDKEFRLVHRHTVLNLPDGSQARDFDEVDFITPKTYEERKAAIVKNGLGDQASAKLRFVTKEERQALEAAKKGGAGAGAGAGIGGGGSGATVAGPRTAQPSGMGGNHAGSPGGLGKAKDLGATLGQ